jgi:hypothetical protein
MSATVTRQFLETVNEFGDRTALRWKVGDGWGVG